MCESERYIPEDWEVLRQAEDLVEEFEKIVEREHDVPPVDE